MTPKWHRSINFCFSFIGSGLDRSHYWNIYQSIFLSKVTKMAFRAEERRTKMTNN